MNHEKTLILVVLVFLLLIPAYYFTAPTGFGSVRGTVMKNSITQAPLENVIIEADGAVHRLTTTDQNGTFNFEMLPGGDYAITAFASNFTIQRSSVHVSDGYTSQLFLQLQPSTATPLLTVDVSPREQNVTAGEAAEFSVSVKTINAPTVVNLAQLSANVQVSAISSVNQLTTSIIPESRVQVSSNHPAAFTLNVQASSQTETGDYAILVMAAWGAGVRPQVFGDVVIVHAQGVNKTSPDQYLQPVRLAIILTMLALILISAFSAYKLVRGRRGPKAANSA